MNQYYSQHRHPEFVIPGGELALLGEDEFTEVGGGGFHQKDIEDDLLEARQVVGGVVFANGGGRSA